jgi:Tol biopolymer transport system component
MICPLRNGAGVSHLSSSAPLKKGIEVRKTVLLLALMVLAVLASCAAQKAGMGPTKPTSPSQNGKIAFTRVDNQVGEFEIFVVEPDGSGLRKLATKPVQDGFPAWSPNGKRLAFEAESQGGNSEVNIDIYVMNADGSELERITKEPTFDSMTSWSPDGSRMAFSMVDISSMFSSASASSSARSIRDSSNENGIYTIRADGADLHQLTDNRLDEYPAWSPDGKTIAFNRLTKTSGGIYTVNEDGGGLRKLTDPPEGFWDSEPSWSPDGTKIAFTRGSGERSGRPDVFTMNADGTHLRKLTGKTEGAYSPDFSPDGKRIVFVGWKAGNKLYVMNADGTDVRRLTKTQAAIDENAPDWQPLPSS